MFGRKKHQTQAPPDPPECKHRWKDFDWYIESTYWAADKFMTIKLFEPYVCIHCKKRKDVLLQQRDANNVKSYKEADEIVGDFADQFKNKIKKRAFIEDQINDFQLVDREALEILKRLNPAKYQTI